MGQVSDRDLIRTQVQIARGLWMRFCGEGPAAMLALVLLRRRVEDGPWMSASQLANEIGTLSDDTVRRRLQLLEDRGHVVRQEIGGRAFYRLSDEAADATIASIRDCYDDLWALSEPDG